MPVNFDLASQDKPWPNVQAVVELVNLRQPRRPADVGRAGGPVRAAGLGYLPALPAGPGRHGGRGQSVWLRLLEQLQTIRDRAALGGWLATTAQRECIEVLRSRRPQPAGYVYVPDVGDIPDDQAGTAEQELFAAERHAALCEALARLPHPVSG